MFKIGETVYYLGHTSLLYNYVAGYKIVCLKGKVEGYRIDDKGNREYLILGKYINEEYIKKNKKLMFEQINKLKKILSEIIMAINHIEKSPNVTIRGKEEIVKE